MSLLNNIPDDNLGLSTLLSIGRGKSFGSGFRFKYMECNYLVTARHVLFDEHYNLRDNLLVLTCQSSSSNDENPLILEVELDKAKIEYSKTNDVAAILLGTNKKLYTSNVPLKEDKSEKKRLTQFIPEDYVQLMAVGNKHIISVDSEATRLLADIKIGNDIYLLGYPMSIGLKNERLFDYEKPLLRKGIIAGKYIKENTFIIDCPSYFGNSGGPIIELGEDNYYRTIGLVSRYIPYVVEWRNTREYISNKEYTNSGFTVCVPMDAVFELIYKKFC